MFTDTTGPTRRETEYLVMRNRKPLQANEWLATLFVALTLASSAVAANAEQLCTHGGQNPKGGTVACYSDAGCKLATSLGGEPVRDYSPSSAPFALARGKITGIITSSSSLITQTKKAGGSCRRL